MRHWIRRRFQDGFGGWHYLFFLLLIVISLRDVLILPGTLGQTWDWEISTFATQIWGRLSHDLFVWDYQLRAGFYAPFRPSGWYSLLALPFSLLGGEWFSKGFIVVPMFLSAVSMRELARRALGLNDGWSAVAGALYMLSPFVYGKIMAGHNILFAYALLPLAVLYVYLTMQRCAAGRRPWRETVISGLLLAYQAIHPSSMVLAFAVVGLVIGLAIVKNSHRVQTVLSVIVMGMIFGLLNIYWALPMASGYFTTGTLYHSGSVVDNPDQVTANTVISQRQNLFLKSMQIMQEAIRQDAIQGYISEFVYPVPGALAPVWLVISFLLPLAAFANLLIPSPSAARGGPAASLPAPPRDIHLVLAISGLLGATLVSGVNVPPGAAIYQWLLLHAFPVWAEFGNTVRAMPLVPLAYAALAPALAQAWLTRVGKRAGRVAVALVLIALAVYLFPFLSGTPMADPKNFFSLKTYQPSTSDQGLYDFLRNDQQDFRVTYVPPPWIFYPENYDLGYSWTGGMSAHPEFFVPYFNPQVWQSASDFRNDLHESVSSKLLGLGAVKYLIYPREKFLDPDLGVSPKPLPSTDNNNPVWARFIDQALAQKTSLSKVTLPFTGTLVYRNNAYLPHLYAATQSTLVSGNSDTLPTIADSSFFGEQPAIFFSAQQDPQLRQRLAAQVDSVVNAGTASLLPDTGRDPAFLLSTEPLANLSATVPISHSAGYAITAQTTPFQYVAPRPGDTTSITFDKSEPGEEPTWSGNLRFNDYLASDSNSLQVAAYLPQTYAASDNVQMNQPIDSLNLADYPYLRITSRVENPAVQAVAVELSLDLQGDGAADVEWTSPPLIHANMKSDELNVLEMVRAQFPDQKQYRVAGIGVRFQRKPQEVWADRKDYPARLYTFGLGDLGFYPQPAPASKPGWTWQVAADLKTEPSAVLSRSVPNLDARHFPVLVEYYADGPAALYADIQLTVKNSQGATMTLPAGSQLIEPYSHGQVSLDVRDALLALDESAGWSPTRVEFILHRLFGGAELRSTTLTLGRIGARWLPDASHPVPTQAPTLMVDGKPVAMTETAVDADHRRYTTASQVLPEGVHRISAVAADPNSAYAVESVELTRSATATNPPATPHVTFENINPTRYRVHVTGAKAPFFLVFSENYHANWSAFVEPATPSASTSSQFAGFNVNRWYDSSALLSAIFDGGKRTELADHYLVNGYANGWRVDRTGSYDLVVEFTPQRFYEGGWLVALATAAASILFLIITRWNKTSATMDESRDAGPVTGGGQ